MEVVLLVGLLLLLLTILAAVAALATLVVRTGPAAEGPVEASPPATDPAETVQRALACAIEGLRADREQDLARTVDTVLALAGDKLGAHLVAGEGQLDRRNELIARQLDGMAGELRRVNDVVIGLQRDRAEQHGQLLSGLQETARQSQTVAATTQSLREALSSSRARGQWGERMADDVLRLAGFVEGVNYVRQRALGSGTVPDFTFLLPGDWLLHMDVKFPMDNYLRHLNAGSEAERRAAAGQFLKDVRERVRSLSGRGYVEAGVTLDFVLLFIPNEATYGFVHEQDVGFADEALRQRVVLCSPFTLFAVLAVVRQAVDSFALQRSTDEILDLLTRFSAQWEKFSDAMDTVGRRLDSASRAYEELSGTRRRQLQRMVDRVDDLRHHGAPDRPSVPPGPAAAERVEIADGPEVSAPAVPLRRPVVEELSEQAAEVGDVRSLARRLTG